MDPYHIIVDLYKYFKSRPRWLKSMSDDLRLECCVGNVLIQYSYYFPSFGSGIKEGTAGSVKLSDIIL